MFSIKEKKYIADVIEKTLLALNHPEMPKEKPVFKIHIEGKENWSWADIEPNWKYKEKEDKTINQWNEVARNVMSKWVKKKNTDSYFPIDNDGTIILGINSIGYCPGELIGEFYFDDKGELIFEPYDISIVKNIDNT